MIVAPGFSRPSRSAVSIIDRAMRSLIDPPGFWLSSFTNSRHGPVSKRVISTTGVSPIKPSTPGRGGADIWVVDILQTHLDVELQKTWTQKTTSHPIPTV